MYHLEHTKQLLAETTGHLEQGSNIERQLVSLARMVIAAMEQNNDIWMHRDYRNAQHLREGQRVTTERHGVGTGGNCDAILWNGEAIVIDWLRMSINSEIDELRYDQEDPQWEQPHDYYETGE